MDQLFVSSMKTICQRSDARAMLEVYRWALVDSFFEDRNHMIEVVRFLDGCIRELSKRTP